MTSCLAPLRGWITIAWFPRQTETNDNLPGGVQPVDHYLIYNKVQCFKIANTLQGHICSSKYPYHRCPVCPYTLQKSKLYGILPIINSWRGFSDLRLWLWWFALISKSSYGSTATPDRWFLDPVKQLSFFFFVSREMLYAGKWASPSQSCFE